MRARALPVGDNAVLVATVNGLNPTDTDVGDKKNLDKNARRVCFLRWRSPGMKRVVWSLHGTFRDLFLLS